MGANLLLNFLVFDRLRTPVTVEADILSSLTDFVREQLPKQATILPAIGTVRNEFTYQSIVIRGSKRGQGRFVTAVGSREITRRV